MAKKCLVILICLSSFFFLAFSQERSIKTGKEIFNDKCAKCHGGDGTKGKWGAADLQKSRLGDPELAEVVSRGRNFMPSWEKRLNADELKSVLEYVKGLRK